ncbi:unnamed protein product [Amoebophrya sp. A25]|nr:unnamed protein product [Amoebophrya sp. A25]|eukprot:GSA25T00018609001.1
MKAAIKDKFLDYGLDDLVLPEWGYPKKGKVRDIYFRDGNVVMVTNDRVSAFDFVLPNLIPFKGQVLNRISEWAFEETADIVPNALVSSPDPSVVVQKKMKNLNVECIVRGYLWGSMAKAYEEGDRVFCGLNVPDGLLRYQKLAEPIFTPTTKVEVGHDENMTFAEVEQLIGKEMAAKVRDISFKLFARGQELMAKRGLLLLDTKYEFGLDANGVLHVIDEVNTPDSSRMCSIEEYEKKWPLIKAAVAESPLSSVNDCLKSDPKLKIKEYSKQYVRDTLLEMGFDPSTAKEAITLSPEQVLECSARYVEVCEKITGEPFQLPTTSGDPKLRLLRNLEAASMISSGLVCIFAGSDSDAPHIEKLKEQFSKTNAGLARIAGCTAKIGTQVRICSAHKQPKRLQGVLKYYNTSDQPIVIIACAGGTDALSGTASFLSTHPVVSCPPDGLENKTCTINPPGSSNAFVGKVGNCARFCTQLLAGKQPAIASYLDAENKKKVASLESADSKLCPVFYADAAAAGGSGGPAPAPGADDTKKKDTKPIAFPASAVESGAGGEGSTTASECEPAARKSGSCPMDFGPAPRTPEEAKACEYKKKIAHQFLNKVETDAVFLPEWGEAKKGKVRDIYFRDDNVIMVTNDRVSAFDVVLPNLIPFKGFVLNAISEWAFEQTKDIVPNALVTSPDPSVVVQKKMKNLNIECIVRGYLWGSMAKAYEKGDRLFCGLKIPDGLLRYQKLAEPIFTPTTKAEVGHDENMTFAEVEELIGKEMAEKVRDISFKLFQRGSEKMAEKGLILIDTKYEFGLDESGVLHVIDEVNTPDSSRMCGIEEYGRKWQEIQKAVTSGEAGDPFAKYKIKEYSKQYVRDCLLEMGFTGNEKEKIKLTPMQVVECSYRYISVFEQITGHAFPWETFLPAENPEKRVVRNLQRAKLLGPGVVLIFAGSGSDAPHLKKIEESCYRVGLSAVHTRICSAHKQPGKLEDVLNRYNQSEQMCIIVGCAGGTDALSGTASFHSKFPVVSCPPDGHVNHTCLTNPPGSSNALIYSVGNAARFCAQVLSQHDVTRSLSKKLLSANDDKVAGLVKADTGFVDEVKAKIAAKA